METDKHLSGTSLGAVAGTTDRPAGSDAVCFTAGPQGIPFAAGVIHAWLASDRQAPKVTAGISGGALSAAALHRSCQEREDGRNLPPVEGESRRWNWFRRYLDAVTNHPLKPIWDAIPDPIDFFADKPPVQDVSVTGLGDERLERAEARARRHYYRLTRLGQWLAGLHISIAEVATCVVRYVRFKERYAWWLLQGFLLVFRALAIAGKILLHLCLSPQFIVERMKNYQFWKPRPLFGWSTWLVVSVLVADAAYWIVKIAGQFILCAERWPYTRELIGFVRTKIGASWPLADTVIGWIFAYIVHDRWQWLFFAAALVGAGAIVVILFMLLATKFMIGLLARTLGVNRALLDSYHLRRQLFELFLRDGNAPNVPENVLLVSAPLQQVNRKFGKQVWLNSKASIVDALLAALAIPGLFPPVQIDEDAIGTIVKEIGPDLASQQPEAPTGLLNAFKASVKSLIDALRQRMAGKSKGLDLIDGALVRQNPLPALFNWLKQNHSVAQALRGTDPGDAAIHLVYSVPANQMGDGTHTRRERVDIVDAAQLGIDLARRRDSRMEFRQTNFLSELALRVQNAGGTPSGLSPIFADEIAPEREIEFKNNLDPQRDELLTAVATGCRTTLETLHRNRLQKFGYQPVVCSALLSAVAPARSRFMQGWSSGLEEVCAKCTKVLRALPDPLELLRQDEAKWKSRLPLEKYAHLAPDNGSQRPAAPHEPRIVFLAAGGVFRGAFHIGVIGAMQAANITPNLIVGASVGTLMGGALGAISAVSSRNDKQRLLNELCLTFLEVDQRVALTKSLKNAAKQVGTRARAVNLSPAQLRGAVRKGTRSDPGYAATGAPSILIDAISTLFLIPHKGTLDIAAEFVAGRITDALQSFWKQARAETLMRLDIETAVIGTSLLEQRAGVLLGAERMNIGTRLDMGKDQPYGGISVFATASDLSRNRPLLLPRDLEDTRVYDFVQAGLSSSAFPAAFRPRQQAEVLPGRGSTDVLYADGGMFDNLPFFPAIEVLMVIQALWRGRQSSCDSREYLQQRLRAPDLFLAASLESELGDADAREPLDSCWEIYRRAEKLSVNGKLDSFRRNSNVTAEHSALLVEALRGGSPSKDVEEFMDNIVNAAVLKVTPSDKKHLNDTFAFSKAAGFDQDKVAMSIADGCYRTLWSLLPQKASQSDNPLAAQAVQVLQHSGRIAKVTERNSSASLGKNECPYFRAQQYRQTESLLSCPFAEASECAEPDQARTLRLIYSQCGKDDTHKAQRPWFHRYKA